MVEHASDPYSAGALSHGLPTEEARLRVLEELLDPPTFELLDSLGPQPGWRCLELGGGAGSVARWLAARCPDGHVTATDVDTRFLDAAPVPNLTVLRHDASTDPFPEAAFDLVHTRLMLHHIPAREEVVARAARWVAPGGWLVVEEPDLWCTDASPYPSAREFVAVFEAFMGAGQGSDYRWAPRLPALVAGCGLGAVGMSVRTYHSAPGPESARAFWRATVAQVGPAIVDAGLLAPEAHAAALALLDDPAYLDQLITVVAAWGRRPL